MVGLLIIILVIFMRAYYIIHVLYLILLFGEYFMDVHSIKEDKQL